MFGIKIPLNAREDQEIVKVKKQFLINTSLVGFVLMVIQLMYNNERVMMITIFTGLVLYFLVYLNAYKTMKAIKASKNWPVDNKTVIDTQFRQKRLVVSPAWYLGYLAIFLVTVVTILINYDSLPDQISMQINSAGQASNFMPKDHGLIYLLLVQAGTLLLIMFLQVIIKRAKQDISSRDVQASIQSNVTFRYVFSIIIYFLGLAVGFVMYLSLLLTMGMIDSDLMLVLTLVITFLPVVLMLVYAVKLRQDGSGQDTGSDVIQKDDDKYWKLGVFYFNPNDPAVFISKRVGVGWSINHARWQAWAFYIGILGFVLLTAIFGG